jgi:hypothetical protein
LFEWRPNQPFDEDDDPDYVYAPELDDEAYKDEEHKWDDVTEDGLEGEFIDDNYGRIYQRAIIDPLVSLDPQSDTTVTRTPALSDPTLSHSNRTTRIRIACPLLKNSSKQIPSLRKKTPHPLTDIT